MVNINWNDLFVPEGSLLEEVIRGTIIYLALFVMLRVTFRREIGLPAVSDLLLLVLLADAAQNGISGHYTSVTEGLVVVGTVVAWAFGMDAASYRWPWFDHLVKPRALVLVKDGRMLRRNMRRELITEDELVAKLREEGITDVSDVREARLEADGEISVIAEGSRKT